MNPFYFTLTASAAFAIGMTVGVFFSHDSDRHALMKSVGIEPRDKTCILLRISAFAFTCSTMLAISGFLIIIIEAIL